MDPNEVKVCSICQASYTGWGNNARPVNNGRCCNTCNGLVTIARLNKMFRREKSKSFLRPEIHEREVS